MSLLPNKLMNKDLHLVKTGFNIKPEGFFNVTPAQQINEQGLAPNDP